MRIETIVTLFVHTTALGMMMAAGWLLLKLFLP